MDWHVTHNCRISRLHFLSGERNPSELDLDHFSLQYVLYVRCIPPLHLDGLI